jgi:hypothetical protein
MHRYIVWITGAGYTARDAIVHAENLVAAYHAAQDLCDEGESVQAVNHA